jgi:hypothetical protein
MDELLKYHQELFDLCSIGAEANATFPQEGFFEYVHEMLGEAGVLDNIEYCPYVNSRLGIKIDGYSWNELEKVINIICLDYTNERDDVQSLSNENIKKAGERVTRFIKKIGDDKFYANLATTDPGREALDLISEFIDSAIKFRVVLITDKTLSTRVKKIEMASIIGLPTVLEIWDLDRLKLLDGSDSDFEEFNVDLTKWSKGVKVLPANTLSDGVSTYLGVMPGHLLSEIYNEFGQRLLESNVRTFLDFRAGTNRGMRKSLLQEPENFFAYNNGITVTGSKIETQTFDGQIHVTKIENMQIVNGGQTTAAIYFSPREKGSIKGLNEEKYFKDIDLQKVYVQMKLTVVGDKETSDAMKSNIATFANSQNSIQLSDLVSNHPFHLNIESRSRNQLVPSGEDGIPTKWFYERARGQYNTQKRALAGPQIRKFEMEYPKHQVFSKTDMAKYENTWRMKPHIVKRGAQANLKSLGSEIISEFDKNPDDFGVNFYKDLVSKMILFRRADKAIQFSVWYKENKGLKAETVTYTLALIRHSILKTGRDINLDLIYQKQALSTSLLALIVSTAQDVKQHIEDPIFRDGVANQSEFCKSERGWKKIQNIGVDLSKLNSEDYIDEQQKSERIKDQQANIVVSKTISFTEQVLQVTETEWTLIAKYNASIYPPSHANVGIPIKCAAFLKGGSMPSDRQLKLAIEIRKNAYSDGFDFLS